MAAVLDVKGLSMEFGGLLALDAIDLSIEQGEIVALIGPNGAGKTTFFNCITGIYQSTRGDIFIRRPGGETERINNLKPNRITAKGLARTFQNVRLFPNMTALENVMVARHCRTHAGIFGAVLKTKQARIEERESVRHAYRLLKRFQLDGQVNTLAKELAYGEQRRLEIARALATEPFLLLLDEPAAGMNPKETEELDGLIKGLRDETGIAILLIEHDMKLVMSISERIYVVDYGEKIAEGKPAEVAVNEKVIKAYLGENFDA
jgi:branched-chain amino acid transport system ATP-binding protein